MHVRKILGEADLYRHQANWKGDKTPSIRVPGRESRKMSSSAVTSFGVYYGFSKLGIRIPKRWKSSFATTDPTNSYFIGYFIKRDNITQFDHTTGIRQVVIPPGTEVGWVRDDFNTANELKHLDWDWVDVIQQIRSTAEKAMQSQSDNSDQLFSELIELNQEMNSMYTSTRTGTDGAYEKFVGLIDRIDSLDIQLNLSSPTLSDRIVDIIKKAIADGAIGATVVEDIPDGNFEVWFEGEYDAVLATDNSKRKPVSPYIQ